MSLRLFVQGIGRFRYSLIVIDMEVNVQFQSFHSPFAAV